VNNLLKEYEMNAMTEVQDPLLFTDNAANKVKQLDRGRR